MRSAAEAGLLFVLLLAIVLGATPEGPQTLDVTSSTMRTPAPASSLEASAGNVSQLNIYGETVTQAWQGYVGNVSGIITLDDSSNYSLYDWTLANPEGEVYATNATTVDWTAGNVVCWNWSDSFGSERQLAEIEDAYGLDSDDADGVNETFTCDRCDERTVTTTHSEFYVGVQFINGTNTDAQGDPSGGPCPSVSLRNGTGDGMFEEVILYEETQNELIYTSLINNDVPGYNNQTWDFQMIVGENGHDGDTETTTYYFYIELE